MKLQQHFLENLELKAVDFQSFKLLTDQIFGFVYSSSTFKITQAYEHMLYAKQESKTFSTVSLIL